MKKNKSLRILSLLVALIILFTASGCKAVSENSSSNSSKTPEKTAERDYLTLLYSAADTFNPYTAKTDINRQLCQLIFDPLVRLNTEFEPVYNVAKNVKTVKNICTVTINQIRFSDGSSLTADDVVYSYNLAKASNGVYSAALYEVKSAKAQNSTTVIFELTKTDPYFVNNLTFPIIKSGSEKITDSDSVLQPPIGCGRYKVDEDKLSLTTNSNYYGKSGKIKNIKLINAPDIDSVTHYVEVGAADIYYNNISDGNILRMSGEKLDIAQNNLIYIGVNQNIDILANVTLRQALSSGIDRKKICNESFYNSAIAAEGFYNPVWEPTKSVQNIQIEANSQITIENLDKIGYNSLDGKNNRVNSNGSGLNFTLLVNSENRLKVSAAMQIASQLKAYGINITIVQKKYAQYLEALKKGAFQLYLGEVRITDNMDVSGLVLKGGTTAYGFKEKPKESDVKETEKATTSEEGTTAEQPPAVDSVELVVNGFYSGENTIADVASVLQTEMPIIPVCYRTGVLFYNDNIENVNNSSVSDIYSSIESYIYKD